MSLTSSQQNSVQGIVTVCSLFSVAGCGVMGYKSFLGRKSNSMIDYLLIYLLAIDFFLSLNLSVGVAATRNIGYCRVKV